jgi:pimeloyl-ACP methyl ester carboxylesterase
MTTTPHSRTSTQFIDRPGGRVAYEVAGHGPLVVLVPGMGDLRQTYRFLAPSLVESGYRVASSDLRGHGDSDATFPSYGDEETAGDILALVDALGGPAIVIGNSMAAGAAVIAAANEPHQVSGLVLVGPFVRNGGGALQRLMLRAMLAPRWAAASWKTYLPKLYAGQRPTDFDDYRTRVIASLRRPGYARAFSLTTRLSHDPAEARLDAVTAPVLILMGERDPDFKDPRTEADWIAQRLHAKVVMVEEAGHYPHSQQPEASLAAIDAFIKDVVARA